MWQQNAFARKYPTKRYSQRATATASAQPMILVSVLAPLISFPISSTIRRSIFPERNAGNQGACNRKCSLFLGHNLAWQAGVNCNLMNFVFNECQSEKDLAACQHPFGHRANRAFETVFPKPLMRFTCAASFAHARLRSSSEVRFPSPREILCD